MKTIELEYDMHPQPRRGGAPNAVLHGIIGGYRAAYANFLEYLLQIREDFISLENEPSAASPFTPYWENGFLPGLDIVTLHGMLRRHNPRRYLEIGSGNSTKVARRAIAMHGLQTKVMSIDPQPRADVDQICDVVVREGLETVDISTFEQLKSGDFLFFDGSHHAFMNSDVAVFFLEVLPVLAPGVFIHVHDICLPYDYPETWTSRFYSEQYVLASALMFGASRFTIEMANMFISKDPELSELLRRFWDHPNLKCVSGRHGASFWFRMTPPAVDTDVRSRMSAPIGQH
jgi:hypothetical protein